MDYRHLPICSSVGDKQVPGSAWNQAISALHGDAMYSVPAVALEFGKDVYCGLLCDVDVLDEEKWKDAIRRDFAYNWVIEGLPAGYRNEDEYVPFDFKHSFGRRLLALIATKISALSIRLYSYTVTTRYWGGVPVGRMGGNLEDNARFAGTLESDAYLYNHWNFLIYYKTSKDGSHSIVRSLVEPFSIHHDDTNKIYSCLTLAGHTTYDMIASAAAAAVQPASGSVRFTYDVIWIAAENETFGKRWNIYLTMDRALPAWIQFLGFFLGLFILVSITGSLATWVFRDLSYKPIVNDAEISEDEATEIQMWPLSTRIFFPPQKGQVLLCIFCGIGAHLVVTSFLFVCLFRFGIISQAQGASLLTPGAIIYILCSPVAGYVTGRLYAIFHGDLKVALASSLASAIVYPLVGIIVISLVYDALPDRNSPQNNVISHVTPFVFIWIFLVWPLTIIGGFVGHRGGAIQNFPVSQGCTGYQDLNLQDGKENDPAAEHAKLSRWQFFVRRHKIALLLIVGGILPAFSCFIGYSYGFAGPIFVGYYSMRSYMISSFLLFVLVSASMATLLYYKQIRAHMYHWWWAAFSTAASAGIYIFLVSMSYVLFRADSHVRSQTIVLYTLFFAFVSFGVALMTGFAGVAACVWFNRALYIYMMRRH
jgi:transmembrane 9 superfamily member 2/4